MPSGWRTRQHRARRRRLAVGRHTVQGLRDAKARVLVTGGPRSGKSTLIGAVSDGMPAMLPSQLLAPLFGRAAPAEAIDLGRMTVSHDPNVELWLLGTPCHSGCWPMWDMLRRDPATLIGAVVLVDVRRPEHCLPALDYLGRSRIPHIFAVNNFGHAPVRVAEQTLTAFGVTPATPVAYGDARNRADARRLLTRLVEHSLKVCGPRFPEPHGAVGG